MPYKEAKMQPRQMSPTQLKQTTHPTKMAVAMLMKKVMATHHHTMAKELFQNAEREDQRES